MRIERLAIDGFGQFADRVEGPLTAPVTIFLGPNEAGKSTYLEFIRTVLFGFPTRNQKLHYPPLRGGRHGGRLTVVSAGGEHFQIDRHAGKGSGSVTVTGPDGTDYGQDKLAQLCGGYGKDVFDNVFAFTLDELTSDDLLDDESVNSQIYSAGLAARRLPAALSAIDKARAEIFTKRGRKHRLLKLAGELDSINEQLAQVQSEETEHLALTERLSRLESQAGDLEERRRQALARATHLRRLLACQDDFVELGLLEEELAELGPVAAISAQTQTRAMELTNRISNSDVELRRAKTRQSDLRGQLPPTPEHSAILGLENGIRHLQHLRGQFDGFVRDRPQRQAELAAHRHQLAESLAQLGPGWDEARLDRSAPTPAERGQLAAHREQRERMRDMQAQSPSDGYRGAAIALGVLGLMIAGIAIWTGAPTAWIAAAVLLLAAIAVEWRGRARRRAGGDIASAEVQWTGWLLRQGLPTDTEPEAVPEIWALAQTAGVQLNNVRNWRRRLAGIEREMSEYSQAVATLAIVIGHPFDRNDSDSVAGAADHLVGLFESVEDQTNARSALVGQIESAADEVARRQADRDSAHHGLTELFATVGVADMTELTERAALSGKREAALKRSAEAEARLQRNCAADESLSDLLALLKAHPVADLKYDLEQVDVSTNEIASQLQSIATHRGSINSDRARLAGNERISGLLLDRGLLNNQIEGAVTEWTRLSLAQVLLRQASRQYERERQPGVINHAAAAFARLTGGRYLRVFSPVGSGSISIAEADGTTKEPAQLSRGTREQLYLALRFGLVAELSKRAEPLPLAVDEILVNFDLPRARRAVAEFLELAKHNQVLFFTCHPLVVGLFQQAALAAGASAVEVVELPGN